jgi:uncharacterized protein (DUF433 family)
MADMIINRGRGPEIAGTRITVYRIMDFVRDKSPPETIAKELRLSSAQVRVALDYIAAHSQEVEAEYEKIRERPRQNPEWVEAGRATSFEELKQRIMARAVKEAAHADRAGQ